VPQFHRLRLSRSEDTGSTYSPSPVYLGKINFLGIIIAGFPGLSRAFSKNVARGLSPLPNLLEDGIIEIKHVNPIP
jgi:hypothetical protein